jgi:hypothetical protein
MPRFEIKTKYQGPVFTKTGVVDRAIRVPAFTAEQMREIAQYSVQVMKERNAQAIDVLDQPAKPLRPKYGKRKAAKGLPAVRNLRLTGNLLGSIHVTEADATHAKVKVEGVTPFRKGIYNQNIDPWFGLSNHDDQRVLNEKVKPMFAQNLKDML